MQVQPVTCWHPPASFHWIGVYLISSSKMIGNFLAVLNFSRLFLKINCFICNQLLVLSNHKLDTYFWLLIGGTIALIWWVSNTWWFSRYHYDIFGLDTFQKIKPHPTSTIIRSAIHWAMTCLAFVGEVGKLWGKMSLWVANQLVFWVFYNCCHGIIAMLTVLPDAKPYCWGPCCHP